MPWSDLPRRHGKARRNWYRHRALHPSLNYHTSNIAARMPSSLWFRSRAVDWSHGEQHTGDRIAKWSGGGEIWCSADGASADSGGPHDSSAHLSERRNAIRVRDDDSIELSGSMNVALHIELKSVVVLYYKLWCVFKLVRFSHSECRP